MAIFSFVKAGKKLFGKQKTTGETINPFKPNKQTYSSKLKIDLAKTPGKVQRQFMPIMRDLDKTGRSLRQTNQKLKREPVTESGFTKGKNLRDKKMGGGMMGRRMGYQAGSKKGKVPTTPKEKSLAKLAPPKDRITFGDVVAGRTKGKRMQARKGTLPLTKRNIKEGEPGKIKKLPFDNISEEKKKLKSQRKP